MLLMKVSINILEIDTDREPVSVNCDVRSSLMEYQFVSPIDGEPVCVTCDKRSRLMENQFDVRSILMENQFVSPVMCALD
ncbi:hypothetical protein RRG08_034474 [Elysia crispata]|uniref:Uncharacterized protein n=1 Tax=Elysia crispata TaxID=231223 RepID=A0AAE1CL59_9GAST|nr:hypothetical protein RRG08_034474 [Elysia crispata]